MSTQAKKPVVVLIHAFPLSSVMWTDQAKALAAACTLVTPDLPGFGKTPLTEAVSIEQMAQWVAGGLDRMGIAEPVVIAGLSMGGYVALEFVRQYPDRVRALALLSTRSAADTPEQQKKREEQVRFVELRGVEPLAEAMLVKLLGRTTQAKKPEVMLRVHALSASARPEGLINALRAMAVRRDLTGLLPSIHKPVLVMAGEEDEVVPLAEARLMAEALPHCRLEILREVGHLSNFESPDAFNRILIDFIQNLDQVG